MGEGRDHLVLPFHEKDILLAPDSWQNLNQGPGTVLNEEPTGVGISFAMNNYITGVYNSS